MSQTTAHLLPNVVSCALRSSNVLGLAVGREKAIRTVKERQGKHDWSVAQDGFGGVDVRVFEAGAHLSITKAGAHLLLCL